MRGKKAKQIRKLVYAGEGHGFTPDKREYGLDPRVNPQETRVVFVQDLNTGYIKTYSEALKDFREDYPDWANIHGVAFLKKFDKFYKRINVSRPIMADEFRRTYQQVKREYTRGIGAWL